ncbi:hypothetical protein, partial [Pedosphaera parvula]
MKIVKISPLVLFCCVLVAALGGTSCSPTKSKEKTAGQRIDERNQRLKWRIATTLGEYERVGMKDPSWDADAKAALESFANMDVTDSSEAYNDLRRVGSYAEAANYKGCKDPLVEYLYMKNGYDWQNHTKAENVKKYTEVGNAMANSGYCEIRKFYGCLRMALTIFDLEAENQDYYRLRHDSEAHLAAALEEKELPPAEAAMACRMMLESTRNNTGEFPAAYEAMEKPLFKNFAKTSVPYVAKGYYNIELAWMA